jgi:hypothetical protein
MSSEQYNITVDQHSDFIRYFLIEQDGSAIDITGFTFAGQIRERYQSDAVVEFTVSIEHATGGKIKVQLTDTQTTAIAAGDYRYDIVSTNTSGIKTRLLQGQCEVSPGVTH